MSELIRREDALKAIEARAYDLESTDSINTAYGCRLGGDVVRALPAIGTCKECALWTSSGKCRSGRYKLPREVLPGTPLDHYCAAYKARCAE